MKRKNFIKNLAFGSGALLTSNLLHASQLPKGEPEGSTHIEPFVFKTTAAVIGGGLGGIAAALGLLRNGHDVLLVEETDWICGCETDSLCVIDRRGGDGIKCLFFEGYGFGRTAESFGRKVTCFFDKKRHFLLKYCPLYRYKI